jgi:hypothetical protein
MSLSEFEIKRIEKPVKAYCENRYPKHMRNELYLDYRIENQSVIIFAVRPHWKIENEIMEEKIAKATYIKNKKEWKIYWQRQDLKWHGYEPVSAVKSIEEFLKVIENDEYACFYG